jgi:hypothetical protein
MANARRRAMFSGDRGSSAGNVTVVLVLGMSSEEFKPAIMPYASAFRAAAT